MGLLTNIYDKTRLSNKERADRSAKEIVSECLQEEQNTSEKKNEEKRE